MIPNEWVASATPPMFPLRAPVATALSPVSCVTGLSWGDFLSPCVCSHPGRLTVGARGGGQGKPLCCAACGSGLVLLVWAICSPAVGPAARERCAYQGGQGPVWISLISVLPK